MASFSTCLSSRHLRALRVSEIMQRMGRLDFAGLQHRVQTTLVGCLVTGKKLAVHGIWIWIFLSSFPTSLSLLCFAPALEAHFHFVEVMWSHRLRAIREWEYHDAGKERSGRRASDVVKLGNERFPVLLFLLCYVTSCYACFILTYPWTYPEDTWSILKWKAYRRRGMTRTTMRSALWRSCPKIGCDALSFQVPYVPLNWDRQMIQMVPTMSAATCCYLTCKCTVLAELCPAVQASIAQALHWHETRTWRVPRKCKWR